MHKVIVNTTPLIALANVGRLNLLRNIYREIIIPQAVYDEIKSEPARSQVRNSDWIKVKSIADETQRPMYRARLHAGEVEVMILAQEQDADLVIIDDNAAKKTAKFLGLTVTGTIGVLLRAKREGYIESIKPVLEDLIKDGLFISDSVKNMALEQAGEDL